MPFNPVLGETFRALQPAFSSSAAASSSSPPPAPPAPADPAAAAPPLHLLVEQVSHHPPVTAFGLWDPLSRAAAAGWAEIAPKRVTTTAPPLAASGPLRSSAADVQPPPLFRLAPRFMGMYVHVAMPGMRCIKARSRRGTTPSAAAAQMVLCRNPLLLPSRKAHAATDSSPSSPPSPSQLPAPAAAGAPSSASPPAPLASAACAPGEELYVATLPALEFHLLPSVHAAVSGGWRVACPQTGLAAEARRRRSLPCCSGVAEGRSLDPHLSVACP